MDGFAPLARLEGRIALEVLTQRLPNLALVPDQTLTYFPSATARRLESLEVAWEVAEGVGGRSRQ